MKKGNRILMYPFILMGILMMLANSCKKDDNSNNNNNNTITDKDGNVYHSVVIGTQEWIVENMNTTKYQDGTNIANVSDGTQWIGLTTGAYCDYDNSSSNSLIYGRLYNWYAATNIHKICPIGWHLPSDSEWNVMVKYLESTIDTTAIDWVGTNIGGKLKEAGTTHWTSPNTGANNSSGFTGLPGGCRSYNSAFNFLGITGNWWTSKEFDITSAWYRALRYDYSQGYRNGYNKVGGLSVRCKKD